MNSRTLSTSQKWPLASITLLALTLLAVTNIYVSSDATAASPARDSQARKKAKKTLLRTGHIDAISARISGGKLKTLVKDATKGNNHVKWRKPASVTVRVLPKARVKLPSGIGFVGPAGSSAWMIPQIEKPGVIWAGWNTEAVDASQVRGDVKWHLRKVNGPGKLVIFQTGSFGESDVIFNSAKRLPQTLSIPLGTHAHANWAFTRKGVYRMTYAMSARSPSGKRLLDTATLAFKVG